MKLVYVVLFEPLVLREEMRRYKLMSPSGQASK